MEDDKLDFGDLDDLDIPQDGLGNTFTSEIEDMAELERELGLDGFDDISAQPSTTDTLPSTNSDSQKKALTTPSKTTATPSSADKSSIDNSSPSRTSSTSTNNDKPPAARSRPPYQNKTHHYNTYNNQQPRFQAMPYPSMPPFNMIPMAGAFGQGFMNMQLPNVNNMGLSMMGNNNIPNGSPPNRRIHVNPKFAAAHPPPSQPNEQAQKEPQQRRTMEQQRSERQPKEEEHQGNQRKRPAELNTLSDNHQRSPYRQRLDTTPESSTQPSLQSRLGRANFELPAKNDTRKDPDPSPSRPSSGHGFSIRGAALAAAAASSGGRVSISSRTPHIRTSPVSGNQPDFSIQGRSSALQRTSNNDKLSITSRLNSNNSRHQQSSNNGNNTRDTILQRLGEGRITKNTKKPDRPIDRQSPRMETLTPLFANGKSSKLIVSNISPKVTESTLKSLEPKDIKVVSLDRGNKNATLLFTGINPAVTFRRKYNRTTLDGEHISVNFAKN